MRPDDQTAAGPTTSTGKPGTPGSKSPNSRNAPSQAELSRLVKVAELDAYLAELEAELGPTTEAERAEATRWADGLLAPRRDRRPA